MKGEKKMQKDELKKVNYKLAKVRGAIAGITELSDKMNNSYHTYRDELCMYVDLIKESIGDVIDMLQNADDGYSFKTDAMKEFSKTPKTMDGASMDIQLEPGEKISFTVSADKGYVDTETDSVEGVDDSKNEDENEDDEECEHCAYTSYKDIPLIYTEDVKSEDDEDEDEKPSEDDDESEDEAKPGFDTDFNNWLDWLDSLSKNMKKPDKDSDEDKSDDDPRYTKQEFITKAIDLAYGLGKIGAPAETIEKVLLELFDGHVDGVKDGYVKRMSHVYANITSIFGKDDR